MASCRRKSKKKDNKKFMPGGETPWEEIFDYNFLTDDKSIEFIRTHKRIMFIIRGLPGTGKSVLAELIHNCYPSSLTCSADNYFNQMFVSATRTRETLTKSHDFCRKSVQEAIKVNTHPIIVRNSHVQKWEVAEYMNFAAQHGYTVLMANTPHKFQMDAEVLAKSNCQGLHKTYFQTRVKQWEEYVPSFLGWFLDPDNSFYVLSQGKKVLTDLLVDDEFCKVFNVTSEEEILEFYEVKNYLFCILAYCGSSVDGQNFYLSTAIQDSYGQVLDFLIQGFLISEAFILAMVDLPPKAKSLFPLKPVESTQSHDVDSLASALEGLDIQASLKPLNSWSTFGQVAESSGQTVTEIEWENDEEVDVKSMSIIVLGESKGKLQPITDVRHFLDGTFSKSMNAEGKIPISKFLKLDNGTKCIRLTQNTWFVQSPNKFTISAILNGLYT